MGAAVAIIIRKERQIVSIYHRAGATSPATARTPDDLNVDQRLAFHALVRRAVLRDVGDGRYYLDEPSWNALRATRTRVVVAMLVAVLVITAILIGTGVIAVGLGVPRLQ